MKHAGLRTAAAGVAAVAALGTLSACGGHSTKASANGSSSSGSTTAASPLAALRAAVTNTNQQQSAKVDGTTKTNQMSVTMKGTLDWSQGMSGNMTLKMSGAQASSATAQLGTDGAMQARYTPDAMFVDMGPTMAKSDGGKPWMKYSYDALAKQLGASGDAMKEEFQNNNPTRSVQMLIASGDVKSLGSATVNGVATTHYAGVVDVDKLLGAQPGLDAATVKQLQGQLKSQGIKNDHIDVWVDGHGLLVEKVEKCAMSSGTMNSTAFYTDYGVKVTVTPPPASQTMDVSKMLAQQGKS
ncbi:hypothetical protein POF50_021260 [Streptomyces sp. SL13]|jgi:hypothetical protein|uniref:LppX_LprAFG lipoprotein n=1 Tax=Streptantibioticus silvisoli TaxID=2705255 RepID=A0AA90KA99_9ACTN|nr:hypothetical protein [Streptantibioticus silvisoli]MDI5971832.1 hypothetical protein [Streptantibioticus silvisoli]